MTTAIITTIRPQLRKRWVRCAACLVLLFAGYVATTSQAVGLAFHPLVRSLPCHPQICNCVFAFYGPVLAVAGSNRCPGVIRQLIMLGMSDRRNDIGSELALTASVYYYHLPCMRDGMTQFGMYLNQREFSLPIAYGLDDDVEYFPLSREANPRAWSRLQEYKSFLDPSYGHHEYRVAVAPLLEGLMPPPPVTSESEEPQLSLEVCPSSRLGGSLALPEDSNWLPPSVLLTPEEFAEMTPEDHDEESRPCFPVRHFPTSADRSKPFVFISYITITR